MKIVWAMVCFLISLHTHEVFSQAFTVKGNVHTATTTVRYASVTFIDQSDTSRKFSTLTDSAGNYQLSVVTEVTDQPSSVPQSIELAQNYPNPFSTSTAISYKLNTQVNATIKIFDILGREVKSFALGLQAGGGHRVEWDGRNDVGAHVSAGVYFCQLRTEHETQTRKMIYAGDGTTMTMPMLANISPAWGLMKKEAAACVSLGTYSVRIENTSSARPKILPTEFPGVVVQQDTTLNFEVQLGIMAYSLCYQRWDSSTINGHWQQDWDIYLNDVMGTNCYDITKSKHNNDYTPAWSPNGRLIAFRRDRGYWGGASDLYLYDVENDTCIGFIVSDSVDADLPSWTPDSKKIVYEYHVIPHPSEPHIINVDGSNDRKLEHNPAFFYPDSYTFLYTDDSARVYKTNIDNSLNEFVLDLKAQRSVLPQDFNPNTEEILFSTYGNGVSTIATYNVGTKDLRVLLSTDTTYRFGRVRWSTDFSKITMIETKSGVADSTHDEYLSVIENGVKRRLVRIPLDTTGGASYFGWYLPKFSPDGKYVAYGKLFVKSGQWITLFKDLYVVDVAKGNIQYVDSGEAYCWNPRRSH